MKLMGDLEFLKRIPTLRVLIVDDYRNMVKTIENMLVDICAFKRKTEQLFRAYDGADAIKIILNQPDGIKHPIDLVFLDWNMPVTPGIEVIRQIRSSDKEFIRNVPVIMITAESMSKDVTNAIYEGVDNYLLKPFVLQDLRNRMNPILRHYWSGGKIVRAKNRRTELRYDAERLKLVAEIELYNGGKKKVDIVNISERGASLGMETDGRIEIKAIHFPSMGYSDEFSNKGEVVGIPPSEDGKGDDKNIRVWFKFGFQNDETKKHWTEWVELAKKKDLEYRGQLRS